MDETPAYLIVEPANRDRTEFIPFANVEGNSFRLGPAEFIPLNRQRDEPFAA
jgi:hypothetical protein